MLNIGLLFVLNKAFLIITDINLKKYGIQLVKPSWEPHISVLKGYPEINKSVPWGWRNGEEIEVHYGHEIFWNKAHVWINTYTPAIDELRHHYG